MGGAGPYVQFSPSYHSSPFTNQTELSNLSGEELEAAYIRAGSFLSQKKRVLVDEHSWSEQADSDESSLFLVTPQGSATGLRLPSSFSSFLDRDRDEEWSRMFRCFFDAQRHNRDNNTLFIKGPTPLSDIFYLLQILAPGMLLIIREDDLDDAGERQTARILPSNAWVRDHQEMLEHVIGSKERYESILTAANDFSKSFKTEYYSCDYDNSSDSYTDIWGWRQPLDYTACGQDCGYCGQCDY